MSKKNKELILRNEIKEKTKDLAVLNGMIVTFFEDKEEILLLLAMQERKQVFDAMQEKAKRYLGAYHSKDPGVAFEAEIDSDDISKRELKFLQMFQDELRELYSIQDAIDNRVFNGKGNVPEYLKNISIH